MEQREVQDAQGTTWTCVQAYGGLGGKKGEIAERLSKDEHQQVPVVCTPRGGAQSVRIKLQENWFEELPDEGLLAEITAAQAATV